MFQVEKVENLVAGAVRGISMEEHQGSQRGHNRPGHLEKKEEYYNSFYSSCEEGG